MKKIFVFCLLILGVNTVMADEGGTEAWVQPGWTYSQSLGASLNYLGLMTKAKISYQIPFIKNPGILWKSTKIEFGLEEYLSPSFTRTSVFLYFEPIAIFNVSVTSGYEVSFPGLTGGLYSFASQNDEYSDAARKAMRDASATDDVPGALAGWRTKIDPTFQIAFGPVAAVYTLTFDFLDYNAPGYFYDAETVTIVQPQDTILTHDGKLLFTLVKDAPTKREVLRAGFSFTDQIVQSSGYASMTAAVMAAYTPVWQKCEAKRISPYGVVLLGTHVKDRYMVGNLYFGSLFGFSMKL